MAGLIFCSNSTRKTRSRASVNCKCTFLDTWSCGKTCQTLLNWSQKHYETVFKVRVSVSPNKKIKPYSRFKTFLCVCVFFVVGFLLHKSRTSFLMGDNIYLKTMSAVVSLWLETGLSRTFTDKGILKDGLHKVFVPSKACCKRERARHTLGKKYLFDVILPLKNGLHKIKAFIFSLPCKKT